MTDYVEEANDAIFLDDDLREAYDHEAESLLAEREIGFDEGHEKGRKEGKIEIATNLLKNGCTVEFVHENTKLSIKEIARLKVDL